MSFSDPTAIILIVGALAILAFVVHGLLFSGRPGNRKLAKNNQRDDKLRDAPEVGKVRIVTNDVSGADGTGSSTFSSTEGQDVDIDVKELTPAEIEAIKERDEGVSIEITAGPKNQWQDAYEINLVSTEREFSGADIEALFNQYGIRRGEHDIYYVYEDDAARTGEAFRICSLKEPYSFPQQMAGYTTPAIAIYMNLPPAGKGYAYFYAMCRAAELLQQRLGGDLKDNYGAPIGAEQIQAMAAELQHYDRTAQTPAQ